MMDDRTRDGQPMAPEETPLSTYVEPEITDARISRQWAAMDGRGLPGPAPRGRWLLATLYATPLVAALALFAWFGAPRGLSSGASVESAEEPINVRLRDGSNVELAAQTRLRMLRDQTDAVEVELAGGRATFDVTHVVGRKFTVSLGDAQVRVVGTRFEVVRSERKEGALLQVSVSRGVVEVRRRDEPGGVRKLTAGETWSALVPHAGQAPTPVAPQPTAAAPSAETVDAVAAQEGGDVGENDVAEAADNDDGAADDRDDHEDHEDHDDHAGSHEHPSRAALARTHARALFQRANVARRAGQLRDAESAYAELLRRFPHDGRAGVSAFELGRIRMDALGDPRGAVAAFAQALTLSPDAGFREDALARIVVARDVMGQTSACRIARDRYLAGYPHGVHAVSLAARCK